MNYELSMAKYGGDVKLFIDTYIIQKLFSNNSETFQTSRDNIYKNYRIRPRLKNNEDWNKTFHLKRI